MRKLSPERPGTCLTLGTCQLTPWHLGSLAPTQACKLPGSPRVSLFSLLRAPQVQRGTLFRQGHPCLTGPTCLIPGPGRGTGRTPGGLIPAQTTTPGLRMAECRRRRRQWLLLWAPLSHAGGPGGRYHPALLLPHRVCGQGLQPTAALGPSQNPLFSMSSSACLPWVPGLSQNHGCLAGVSLSQDARTLPDKGGLQTHSPSLVSRPEHSPDARWNLRPEQAWHGAGSAALGSSVPGSPPLSRLHANYCIHLLSLFT